MTESELVRGVQAHFDKFDPEFEDRVKATIAFGIARFCAHTQWEFLDRYAVNLTVQASTVAAVGKPEIVTPNDYFKPVVIYSESREIEYVSRQRWAQEQTTLSSTLSERTYTVIGSELILTRTHDGSQIDMIYTRDATGITLDDIPGQYHPAVQAAIQLQLTPAYFTLDGKMIPNPAIGAGQQLYSIEIGRAMTSEVSNKGRRKPVEPSRIAARRNAYT